LWGLHIQDPLAGENAPAGPMYNRDGTVRQAWYDPVGWAGLDKVPPSNLALKRILEQHLTLGVHQAKLIEKIEEKSHTLAGLGLEAAAVQNQPHLKTIFESYQAQIKELSAEVDGLRAEFAENRAKLEAFELYALQLRRGERGLARSHLRRTVRPIPPEELQFGRLMETWAALSIGLMLISLVSFLFLAPQNWFVGLFAIGSVFIIIEATFRRWLTRLVTQVTLGLAVLATLVLFIAYFPQITILTALIAGTYMSWENLRELWD
jgi:predicted RND superfamily exporter protein